MRKEELVNLLMEKGLTEQEIDIMIEKKKNLLGHHVTLEGVYALLAAEHGKKLEFDEPKLDIENVQPGLSNLNMVAKVLRIYDEKEFSKGDKTGKRQSILLGDASGRIFLTLWDKEIDQYRNKVHNGDIVRLLDAVSGSGPSGPQLRLGFRGRMVVEDESKFKELSSFAQKKTPRKTLDKISDQDKTVESRATISNIYRLTIYDACPTCRKRLVKTTNNAYYCENCKTRTNPKKSMVLEIGLDDGYSHVRAVLFGDSASELLDETPDTIHKDLQEYLDAGYNPKNAGLEYVLENRPNLLGSEILITGGVSRNELKGIVINVYDVKSIDIELETNLVLDSLEREFGD